LAVGRWPFPVDISADQLPHGSKLPPLLSRVILRVTYKDFQVSRGPSSHQPPK
jgi:hypothetical protein